MHKIGHLADVMHRVHDCQVGRTFLAARCTFPGPSVEETLCQLLAEGRSVLRLQAYWAGVNIYLTNADSSSRFCKQNYDGLHQC